MIKGLPEKLSKTQLDVFSELLGSAPVLSTEDVKHYHEIWERLIDCFTPQDFMELLLIRQVQNETWKILRYTRHQSVAIDRRFRQSLEFQVQRTKEQNARREAAADLDKRMGRPVVDLARPTELRDMIESSIADLDDILRRTPTELDHNRALEAGIVFEEQLDRLINSALRRRNDALEQLEIYRAGLGRHWRKISDDIIDVSSTEVAQQQMPAPALVPPGRVQQPVDGERAAPATSGAPAAEAHPNETVSPEIAAFVENGLRPEQASN